MHFDNNKYVSTELCILSLGGLSFVIYIPTSQMVNYANLMNETTSIFDREDDVNPIQKAFGPALTIGDSYKKSPRANAQPAGHNGHSTNISTSTQHIHHPCMFPSATNNYMIPLILHSNIFFLWYKHMHASVCTKCMCCD